MEYFMPTAIELFNDYSLDRLNEDEVTEQIKALQENFDAGKLNVLLSQCHVAQLLLVEKVYPEQAAIAKESLGAYKAALIRLVDNIKAIGTYKQAIIEIETQEKAPFKPSLNILPKFLSVKSVVIPLKSQALLYLAHKRYHSLETLSKNDIRNMTFDLLAVSINVQAQLFLGDIAIGRRGIGSLLFSGSRVMSAVRRANLPDDFYTITATEKYVPRLEMYRKSVTIFESWASWGYDKVGGFFASNSTPGAETTSLEEKNEVSLHTP